MNRQTTAARTANMGYTTMRGAVLRKTVLCKVEHLFFVSSVVLKSPTTINRVHALASWNFKHIVNLDRIKGYNSVNLQLGYPAIEIRTPQELVTYGD